MPLDKPVTYSGEQCNEIARVVFYKAMTKMSEMLDSTVAVNSDRFTALAAVCEVCSNDMEFDGE